MNCIDLELIPFPDDPCSCQKYCLKQLDLTQGQKVSIPSSSSSFYFDVSLSSCVELPLLCKTDARCTFTDKTHCETSCLSRGKLEEDDTNSEVNGDIVKIEDEAVLGGCESTKLGCCSDGSAKVESKLCRKYVSSMKHPMYMLLCDC